MAIFVVPRQVLDKIEGVEDTYEDYVGKSGRAYRAYRVGRELILGKKKKEK